MPHFGDRKAATPEELGALMKDNGLSQARVAELVHVSKRQVSNWMTGGSSTPMWAVELLRLKIMLGMTGDPPPA